jgi:hypothetical protein
MLCDSTKMEVKLTTPTETSVSHIPVSFRGQDKIMSRGWRRKDPPKPPPFLDERTHQDQKQRVIYCVIMKS